MKKRSGGKIVSNQERIAYDFARKLLLWNRYDNSREMPWKGEKNPYKIWLSEVILQQTRVEQGLKYYQKFIETFADVHALANAPEARVLKLWEGLGYYSRCRNLVQSAKYISKELDGVFPREYDDILTLKGVGSYTAAAIASFAYNLPYAVLDGNVFRVLSRIFDIEIPIDSAQGKKTFSALAQDILPKNKAGEYNQAIMDFGAVICKPVPLCNECFFSKYCLAYLKGKQDLLPVKEKRPKIRKRWLNYFIVQCGDEMLIQQRNEKDIWQGLHQFVLIETEKKFKKKDLENLFRKQFGVENYLIQQDWSETQQLSHQTICFHFLVLNIKTKRRVENYHWVKFPEAQKLAFPKTLQQALRTRVSDCWQ